TRTDRIGERRDQDTVAVVTRSCVLRTWRPLACLTNPHHFTETERLWRRGRRRRTGAPAPHARLPHFFLSFDEFAVIRRIEIEQGAARFKVLNEGLADRISGTGREHRHDEAGGENIDDRYRFERAGRAHAAGRRDHATGKRGDQRLTAVL